jgi:TetR/AcrR family transcriptional regulator, regulator of biofilm formation and stress response
VPQKTDGRLERGRARRELLLDAAIRVIAAMGAGNLTHRAVAAEAGVSLASITYHFPGIVDLRRAAFEHAGSRIGLAFRDLVEAHHDEPARLPELTADYLTTLVGAGREDTLAVFEMILASSRDAALRPVLSDLNGYLADLLATFVGDRPTGLVVASALQGLLLSHLIAGDSADVSVLRRAVADLLRRFAPPTL